ncbi:MAG: FkbM family methyltransferase [Bacteroidia bacterium]|nr:FkbM family methyltransferase [Bacteroidia bacterium]
MERITSWIRHQLGVLRSRVIYYWQPGKIALLTRFFAEYLPPNALCFDIGAHLGNRTKVWRKLGARVIAVEPQEACLRFLHKQFGQDEQVTILPVAVASESGEKLLYVSAITPTITTLADKEWQTDMQELSSFHVQWDYTVPVKTVTLEELVQTYGVPDFCKIDVEDLELEVLMGLHTALPLLSFEYLSARITKTLACIERLEELGQYEYNWSFGESHQMESMEWLPAQNILDILKLYTRENRSGDIYARLISTLN